MPTERELRIQAALKARLLQAIKEQQGETPKLHPDVPRVMMSLQAVLGKINSDADALSGDLTTTFNAISRVASTLEDIIHISGYYQKKTLGEDDNLVERLEQAQKYPVPNQASLQTFTAVKDALYKARAALLSAQDQLDTVSNYNKAQN